MVRDRTIESDVFLIGFEVVSVQGLDERKENGLVDLCRIPMVFKVFDEMSLRRVSGDAIRRSEC